MKYAKVLTIIFLAAALIGSIVITANEVMAKVGDNVQAVCSVCHTMHHSQDGTDPDHGFRSGSTSSGANTALLYGTSDTADNRACVACHADPTGAGANGYAALTGAPLINLDAADLLAGGTYVTASDAARHNVEGIATQDVALTNIPPGGADTDIGSNDQVSCAGTTGCHGDRSITDNVKAIHGAHHTDDTTINGDSVGESFRFLSIDTVNVAFSASGVEGLEHNYWEAGRKDTKSDTITSLNATEHNVYQASGINKVCASCHGNYHGTGSGEQGGQDEPWIRHPTDITLTSAAQYGPDEYKDYPNEAAVYHTQTPVGFADSGEIGVAAIDKSQGQVLCISCHRAHGSEWDDILRWNYSTMWATGGTGTTETGCNRCHTSK
jgi:cytochrome c553